MATSLKLASQLLVKEVSQRAESGGVRIVGIPTGYTKIDDVLGGYRRKAHYVFAGRTGMGKSSLALWSAIPAAMNGESVLYASFEMNAEMLALRTLAGLTGLSAFSIERGLLNKEDLKKLNTALDQIADMNFLVVDETMTSETFVEKVKNYQQKTGQLGLVVADYVSLFRDKTSFGENDRISRISGNIAALAMDENIPVLLLAQLNREADKRESHLPTLSDLRDSGSLEQDAYGVLFTFRPHYYAMLMDGEPPKDIEYDSKILIAKNKNGESGGQVSVSFHPKTMRWSNAAPPVNDPPSLKGRVKA